MKKHLLLLCAGLLLSGCEQETTVNATYDCGGGRVLQTAFTDGNHVSVTYNGTTVTLPRTVSASGAKYESPETGTVFWSKGIDANFVEKEGGAVLGCRRS